MIPTQLLALNAEKDESALELEQKALAPYCSMMVGTFYKIDFLTSFILRQQEASVSYMESLAEKAVNSLDTMSSWLDEILQDLNELANEAEQITQLPPIISETMESSSYIRRLLGEGAFWTAYENTKLAEENIGPLIGDLYATIRAQTKEFILGYLEDWDVLVLEELLEFINSVNKTFYHKFIGVDRIIPSHMYPQITTKATYIAENDIVDDVVVGQVYDFDKYKGPVAPVVGPDYTLDEFLATKDTSMLLNRSEYEEMKKWWTSNYRYKDNLFVNGIFTDNYDTSLRSKDTRGPSASEPMSHRTSYYSVWPALDLSGNVLGMFPYFTTDANGDKELYSYTYTDSLTSKERTLTPPSSSMPTTSKWSVMDILYEMTQIVQSTSGVCELYPEMYSIWQDTLDAFSISTPTPESFLAYHADYTNNDKNPQDFNISILKKTMDVVVPLIEDINTKIDEVESIVERW